MRREPCVYCGYVLKDIAEMEVTQCPKCKLFLWPSFFDITLFYITNDGKIYRRLEE